VGSSVEVSGRILGMKPSLHRDVHIWLGVTHCWIPHVTAPQPTPPMHDQAVTLSPLFGQNSLAGKC
jgi:hypothetical protein